MTYISMTLNIQKKYFYIFIVTDLFLEFLNKVIYNFDEIYNFIN